MEPLLKFDGLSRYSKNEIKLIAFLKENVPCLASDRQFSKSLILVHVVLVHLQHYWYSLHIIDLFHENKIPFAGKSQQY